MIRITPQGAYVVLWLIAGTPNCLPELVEEHVPWYQSDLHVWFDQGVCNVSYRADPDQVPKYWYGYNYYTVNRRAASAFNRNSIEVTLHLWGVVEE